MTVTGMNWDLYVTRKVVKLTSLFAKEGNIEEIIEAKYLEETISKSLVYYAGHLKPPKVTQIVAGSRTPYDKGKVKVTDPISYFRSIYSTA